MGHRESAGGRRQGRHPRGCELRIFSRKVVDFRSVGWSFSAGSAGRGAWRGVALGVQGWRRRMAKMGAKEGCNKVKKIVANHKINNKAVI